MRGREGGKIGTMGGVRLPFLLLCICIAGQLPGRAHSSVVWPPPHAASTTDGEVGGSPGVVDVDSVAVDGGQYQRSAVLGAKLEEAVAKQLADEARSHARWLTGPRKNAVCNSNTGFIWALDDDAHLLSQAQDRSDTHATPCRLAEKKSLLVEKKIHHLQHEGV